MGETAITLFIVLANVVLLTLLGGIVIFLYQYRKRKVLHEKEKALMEEQHKLEILNTQLQSQEQTMQFIGREIHDSVSQKLTLAAIYTQRLEFENKFPEDADKLQRISNVISDSLEELRDLSRTLANNQMHNSSLEDLINFECGRVSDTGMCKAELHYSLTKPMNVTAKSFLLRILQEFMQNSLKYSECSLIKIELYDSENGITLTAFDNGKGFDTSKVKLKGIGLLNMNRRVHLLGGKLDFQSEPGKGTSLQIDIPDEKLLG